MHKRPLKYALFVLVASLASPLTVATVPSEFDPSLTDPITLEYLESSAGLSLGWQLGALTTTKKTSDLKSLVPYKQLAQALANDLGDEEERIKQKSKSYRGRISAFNLNWLASDTAHFTLVGVLARFDRILQIPSSCGELRLIYRFGYSSPEESSDLPMTLVLVFDMDRDPSGSCKALARNFVNPNGESQKSIRSRIGASSHPLSAIGKRQKKPKLLEINVQLARWPWDGTPEFSDQVHYLLRAFKFTDDGLQIRTSGLENTIDTERLRQDPIAKRALFEWLTQPGQLQKIERGTVLVPAEFLADHALSVSPFGPNRLANKPFSALFGPEEFADTNFSETKVIKSGSNLLQRLDSLSCVGCHQTGSIAGFHFLGFSHQSGANPTFNSLATPYSKHFIEIQGWRTQLGESVAKGLSPDGFSFPEVRDTQTAPDCLTKDTVCAMGQSCDRGVLLSEFDSLSDRFKEAKLATCDYRGVCASTRNGFPGGLCSAGCDRDHGRSACVPVPVLGDFSLCLEKGEKFEKCLKQHSIRSLMPMCNTSSDCRNDYACISVSVTRGICAPPYFLPQLTIEHHRGI